MDEIKLGPDEDSVPDFALHSYCVCLGHQAAWCSAGVGGGVTEACCNLGLG